MSGISAQRNPHIAPESDGRPHIAGIGVDLDNPHPARAFLGAAGVLRGVIVVAVPYQPEGDPTALAALLEGHSALPLRMARADEPLVPGTVYLAAPGAWVTFDQGRVTLISGGEHPPHPLDYLLRSLADCCAERSAAVILAGGHSGEEGVPAISAAGGMVLLQEPDADDTHLPAMAAQLADATLPPDRLPGALAQAIDSSALIPTIAEENAGLDTIFQLLNERWEVDFASYKPTTIGRGIQRRMATCGIESISAYARQLAGNTSEIDRLYRDLLIRVTEFFRTPETFDALEQRALPEIFHDRSDDQEIRVWVAGCASGEEAYSIAILLHEQAVKRGFSGKITIFATDLHRPSLSIASQGIYPADHLAHMSAERRLGYFQELADGSYKVAPELRKLIVFAPHNIISDPPFTRLDLICCRNLLIYLRPPQQEKVVATLHFALRSGGFLFLGISEGLGQMADEFTAIEPRLKLFRKARDLKPTIDVTPRERTILAAEQTAPLTIARPLVGIERQLLHAYDRLLDRYMPTGVLLDGQRRPLHYFGAMARYMQQPQGRAEVDFLRMVDPTLGLALGNGIQRATLAEQPVNMRGIRVVTPDGERYVDITFERLGDGRVQATHTIITFSELDLQPSLLSPTGVPPQDADAFDIESEWRQRIDDLEHELSYTRENLQATIEELQTSNEELQATNEELLAANEELQSVNEGLQSLNEELQSLNAEFEIKHNELKDLNRDYDDLIRSTRVAILSLDRELRIHRYSPMIDVFFDLQPVDLGRPITSIAYKLDGQATLIDDLRHVLAAEMQIERAVQVADGRWFQLRARPILNEIHTLVGVVLMYIDISELKQAQDLAARSGQRLRGALESSLDAFYLLESVRDSHNTIIDFRLVEVNHEGARRMSAPINKLLGERLSAIVADADYVAELTELYRQVIESGVPMTRERLNRLPSGQYWFRQQFVRVGDGVAITSADITQRVSAEEQLSASERRYHTLVETSPAGIFHTDAGGACTYVNPRWCEITGMEPGAALGSGWQRNLHPDNARRVVDAWAAAVAARREFQIETRFQRPDGSVSWVLSQAAPEIGDDGQTIGYVGTLIEISQRIAAEELLRQRSAQLAAANDDLARAARLKDQFLANMSHELRTPLTGVIGFSEALSQGIYGDLEAAQQRAVQHIFDNGQHLLSLINDILDLARIGAGQVDLKLGPVIVDDICAEVIDLIRPLMSTKGQRFSLARPPSGLVIEADVLRLRQILINLLANAVKFTPERGELGLKVTNDEARGLVRFDIWDHGIGIAPSQQPLLFQPFVQLDNRLSREQAGTGLGLALVHQLVTLHGGTIELESTPGQGSCFTVVLPQRSQPDLPELRAARPGSDSVTAASRPAHQLILLAEDDSSVAALLDDYLSAQGYALTHVSNGNKALDHITNLRPALALIDIQLPGISGLEIIAQLRTNPDPQIANIPVIAITAQAMIGDRERCLAAGANEYLSKPVRLDEIGVIVARLLAK